PGHDEGPGGHDGKTVHMHAGKLLRRRGGVVGEHHIRVDPHKVVDAGKLADVHVAVQAHIVADMAVALDVGQRADADVVTDDRAFADGHAVAGLQPCADGGTAVQDGPAAQQRPGADDQRVVVAGVVLVKIHQVLAQDAAGPDPGPRPQGDAAAHDGMAVDKDAVAQGDAVL